MFITIIKIALKSKKSTWNKKEDKGFIIVGNTIYMVYLHNNVKNEIRYKELFYKIKLLVQKNQKIKRKNVCSYISLVNNDKSKFNIKKMIKRHFSLLMY
ncbi:hypothetical protein CH76_00230 [Lysinibacillus sp. BF-4]|nr:hypothetical protein CH76_00230 [Lysinibacillus sp. BF-4]